MQPAADVICHSAAKTAPAGSLVRKSRPGSKSETQIPRANAGQQKGISDGTDNRCRTFGQDQ
jgi:hypothetical protein